MHIPPQQHEPQSVQTVINDLTKQKDQLDTSIKWIQNIAESIQAHPEIVFTLASRINSLSRDADIAFEISASGRKRDVIIFTIVGSYGQEEMNKAIQGDLESIEIFQAMQAQQWLKAYQTRSFDKWIVPETHIWHNTLDATVTWLTGQVKQWIQYWFNRAPKLKFRPREDLVVERH